MGYSSVYSTSRAPEGVDVALRDLHAVQPEEIDAGRHLATAVADEFILEVLADVGDPRGSKVVGDAGKVLGELSQGGERISRGEDVLDGLAADTCAVRSVAK
jgi:hypothetical protein